MTNSSPEKVIGKRERLIASAAELCHRQGLERPTLAEIADAADVPPGNVYYYFKTKDELIEAVIDARAAEVRELLATLGRRRSPAARLKALAHNWVEARQLVANEGCPLGTLSVDANNHGDGIDRQAAKLFSDLVDWSAEQFHEMGVRDARDQALSLLSTVQGAAILSSAFHDPEILVDQVRRLERWIDSLA
jgi:TetR/AcrR family transcriptional repressor of nem operon